MATTTAPSTPVSTTMTSREFNQDTGRAKKATANGPVFVTDRGAPTHVLLSIEEYRNLAHTGKSLAELLAMPEGEGPSLEAIEAFEAEIENFRKSAPPSKRMEELMHDLEQIVE